MPRAKRTRPLVVVLRIVTDVWGDSWDITEERPTNYGWLLCLGHPTGRPRGRGAGGPQIVVTPELATYLDQHRRRPGAIRLPCGQTTVGRVRRLLGHNWAADEWAHWSKHLDDFLTMTLAEIAAKHGVAESTALNYQVLFFGHKTRSADWWRDPDVLELLEGNTPRAIVADRLDLSVGAVGRLRWVAREIAAGRNRTGSGVLIKKAPKNDHDHQQ